MRKIRLKTEWAFALGMLIGVTLGLLTMEFFLALNIAFMTTLLTVAVNHFIGEKRKGVKVNNYENQN
ncbi:hypothetical protein [Staphylococcus phage LY01]|nr:hypothetical protein [Staphylococcus phage LY01]